MRRHTASGKAVDKLARHQRSGNRTGGIDHVIGGPAGKRDAGKLCKIELVEQQAGHREPRDHRQPDKAEPEARIAHHGAPPPVIDPVDPDDIGIRAVIDARFGRRRHHPF